MWFEKLVGFKEENPKQVQSNLEIDGEFLRSKVNGETFKIGKFEVLTLNELKTKVSTFENYSTSIMVEEVIGDVQKFHVLESNNGAFFQVASQFNTLEMVSPHYTPEDGVGIYEYDYTQGPACAIACGAGTIFRNYLVNVDGQIGQSSEKQIDCLKKIGEALGNEDEKLWEMINGYALASEVGLQKNSNMINSMSKEEYELLKEKLSIGIQWNTQVTICKSNNIVSQAYCSALPVAYSDVESELWYDFAQLILEASYEATLYAALSNFQKTGNNQVYLTLLGGGAFGNDIYWIISALSKAIKKFHKTPLHLKIVSHSRSNPNVQKMIQEFGNC